MLLGLVRIVFLVHTMSTKPGHWPAYGVPKMSKNIFVNMDLNENSIKKINVTNSTDENETSLLEVVEETSIIFGG